MKDNLWRIEGEGWLLFPQRCLKHFLLEYFALVNALRPLTQLMISLFLQFLSPLHFHTFYDLNMVIPKPFWQFSVRSYSDLLERPLTLYVTYPAISQITFYLELEMCHFLFLIFFYPFFCLWLILVTHFTSYLINFLNILFEKQFKRFNQDVKQTPDAPCCAARLLWDHQFPWVRQGCKHGPP